MSELHTNFLLNTDNASANDIETLDEAVRNKVWANSGIALTWEIRRMGHFEPGKEVREFLDSDVFTGGGSSLVFDSEVILSLTQHKPKDRTHP